LIRVYLDTNVLVMGILKKDSNSMTVLDLVSEGAIRAVISDYSIEELRAVLRRLMHKTDADRRCYFFMKSVSLNPLFEIINYEQHKGKKEQYQKYIVEKDLPHLVIAAEEKVDSIIVKDRHFTDQDVVMALTPKQLLENMGMRTFDSDL
jgi:predicted nucleic acid-binding protein